MMIRFLRRLLRQVDRTIFLIIDSHPVHISMAVDRWVAKQKGRIQLFFLPGYSPDLNPDEYLNQDVKTKAVGWQRPQDSGRTELRAGPPKGGRLTLG